MQFIGPIFSYASDLDTNFLKPQHPYNLSYLYDIFYDKDHHGTMDIDFYLLKAAEIGSEILEVGCGTGRILIPLVQMGKQVDGLDPDAKRLDFLRFKLSKIGIKQKEQVHLYPITLTEFETGKLYDGIFFPFRVFQHFYNFEEQQENLLISKRLLNENGIIILDVFFTNFDQFHQNTKKLFLHQSINDLNKNLHINKSYYKNSINPEEQYFTGYWVYHIYEGSRLLEEIIEPLGPMYCYSYLELLKLFDSCGLKVLEEWGGFDGSSIGEGGEMIFVLQR